MNTGIIILIVALAAVAAAGVVAAAVLRRDLARQGAGHEAAKAAAEEAAAQRLRAAEEAHGRIEAELRTARAEAERARDRAAEELRAESERRAGAERELAALRASTAAQIEALRARSEEERREEEERRTKAAEELRLQFRNLAGEILAEQTQQLRRTGSESVDSVLKPFGEKLAEFRERVERIYSHENEQRGELRNELRNLMELNHRITTETTNLTNALKGNSKVQGDFGEMLLDTILSSSSLVKGIHYRTQEVRRDQTGAAVRPDVILNLPEGKQIVIDSKTSLTAFTDYMAAELPAEREARLRAHLDSVRRHVQELAAKNYQELMSCSPDFVILFIPNEPAFLAAMQADPSIWADAYRRKVVISSPTNLFALLKLVDNLWQRSDLERNTRDIAECGSKIYDQLVAFTESLLRVEKGLKDAQGAYDDAFKRFTRGNNNLVRLGERMVGLHVKARKSLPQQVLEAAELDCPAKEPEAPAKELEE